MKLLQIKFREIALLLVILLTSLAAGMDDSRLNRLVDRNALLATLATFVVIALFRHLQMALIVVTLILSIGANLPQDMALALGISQFALMASLGLLVAVSLLNSRFQFLPSGIGNARSPIMEIAQTRQAVMVAVSKGDVTTLNKLLAMNAGVNFYQDGKAPIHLAAEKGYSDVVQVLLEHGANFNLKDGEGRTPLEIALGKKFGRTSEMLFNVSRPYFSQPVQTDLRNVDAEGWREQFNDKLRTTFRRNLRMTH